MRQSLVDLFNNAIIFDYKLPCKGINKSVVTTRDNDYVYKVIDNHKISDVIYNGILDLAFENYKLIDVDLNDRMSEALETKIRYNIGDHDEKLKLGFYGEVLLNILLQLKFGTEVMGARGEFYNLLSKTEVTGYDCFHVVENNNRLEFWFGEVKFYASYSAALNSVWDSLQKDISFSFFNKNILAIISSNKEIESKNKLLARFVNDCKKNPIISSTIAKHIISYNGKLIYPVMIISNEMKDCSMIKKCIDKINILQHDHPIYFDEDMEIDLFFIFLPVNDGKSIKEEVLKWITSKKELI